MDDYTAFPPESVDWSSPEFSVLLLTEQSWESMFNGNPERRKELIPTGHWSYNGYGEIISVRPVVVDFGDFEFEIGDFTSDQRCVGEFIHVIIDRLDMSFHSGAIKGSEPDAPPNSRPPSQLPALSDGRTSDSQRTTFSGGCG